MNYHSTVAEVIKHGMMTVVDSAQECDKIKMVQQQLESHSFPFNTGQPLAQDAAALKIKNPAILIRIKPSKLAFGVLIQSSGSGDKTYKKVKSHIYYNEMG